MGSMQTLRALLSCVALLILGACAHGPPQAGQQPLLVLVSLDGFRPDYLDRGITPNLSRLVAEGARGEMRPSFPSKTFPNHFTLVTGLRPNRHGIVDNTFEDPEIPGVRFSMSNRVAVADPRWWSDGTPIWITAERAGLRTAPVYWPGSETTFGGVRPTYWSPFAKTLPAEGRVDVTLAYLDQPQRPAFATLYMEDVDTAGHDFGPDSAELNAAVARVDAALGRFVAGLQARRIEANLVIVADHGMAATAPERAIILDDLLPLDAIRTTGLGAFLAGAAAAGRGAEVDAALLRPHPNMECWRKGDIPAKHRYGSHRRVQPIFCLPRTGWEITTRERYAKDPPGGGNHGFDPAAAEMRALFIGAGPAFRAGVRPAVFDNVDIYPLMARLLGVRPEPNDGDLDELAQALK